MNNIKIITMLINKCFLVLWWWCFGAVCSFWGIACIISQYSWFIHSEAWTQNFLDSSTHSGCTRTLCPHTSTFYTMGYIYRGVYKEHRSNYHSVFSIKSRIQSPTLRQLEAEAVWRKAPRTENSRIPTSKMLTLRKIQISMLAHTGYGLAKSWETDGSISSSSSFIEWGWEAKAFEDLAGPVSGLGNGSCPIAGFWETWPLSYRAPTVA